MIELTKEQLQGVQKAQLEMLIEVDRICKKNGISYNIIAGTLLGAVRHGGYIPWDDDADVAMLRSEYDRFVTACRNDLDTERFYFQDHRLTEGYRWGYGKLRRKDTIFLREHQEHMPYEQGVFIDIFPLDCVPNGKFGRTVKNFECFLIRKMLWAKVGKKADRDPVKRTVYSLLDLIPEKTAKGFLDRLIIKASRINTDWVRILMFPTPNSEYGYRRKWYTEISEYIFEGHSFTGIKERDEYLSFKYGEYMKLPPESERKTHPVSDIKI